MSNEPLYQTVKRIEQFWRGTRSDALTNGCYNLMGYDARVVLDETIATLGALYEFLKPKEEELAESSGDRSQ